MAPSSPSALLCGTAGWAYPDWDGIVYPRPRPRHFHELEHLARFVDAVEINTSFYGALKPEITKLWIQRVSQNRNFLFTVKLGRRFTHERILDAADVEQFKAGLRPLAQAGRLGCVLMQFPWSYRFTEENRDYFIELRRAFHEFPLVAEMRHASWMFDEALGTFIDYHVGFVNIDQPQYTKAMPPTAFLTSGIGYVRLHGRNNPDTWAREQDRKHDYCYSETELREWMTRIERIRVHARQTFVVFNNDGNGKAVVNALQMQHLLDRQKPLAPRPLLAAYREQLRGFLAEGPKQESLFAMPVRRQGAQPPLEVRRAVA